MYKDIGAGYIYSWNSYKQKESDNMTREFIKSVIKTNECNISVTREWIKQGCVLDAQLHLDAHIVAGEHLAQFLDSKIAFEDMNDVAKGYFSSMPSWGTYGT